MKYLTAALCLMTLANSGAHATSRSPETYCENGSTQVFIYNDQAHRQVVIKENNLITFESEIELTVHELGVIYKAKEISVTLAAESTVEGQAGFLSNSIIGMKVMCRTRLNQ